jgi:hypothetical protein
MTDSIVETKSTIELFAFLSDLSYDIKEKITEYEYMQLMEHLKVLHERFQTGQSVRQEETNQTVEMDNQIPNTHTRMDHIINVVLPPLANVINNVCHCRDGHFAWCISSIALMQACRNFNTLIEEMPLIKLALDYKNTIIEEVETMTINRGQPLLHLQLEPIGENPDMSRIDEIRMKYLLHTYHSLKIIENCKSELSKCSKCIIVIANYEYTIRNIYTVVENKKLLQSGLNKLKEFITKPSTCNVFELISNRIFGLNTNILLTYKDILERIELQQEIAMYNY